MTGKIGRRLATALCALLVLTLICPTASLTERDYSAMVTEPGTFPVVTEPATMTIFAARQAMTAPFETNRFTPWYEEKSGVHIDWIDVTASDSSDKLNLLLSSGDYPEVLLYTTLNISQIILYARQGMILPVNEYLDKYSIYAKQVIDEKPYMRKGLTDPSDGLIYALPMTEECYEHQVPYKMWIYMPWLDALGLSVPTTTEEFKQMLIAFRDNDPNGNGLKDELPLAGGNAWNSQLDTFLMQPFTYWDRGLMLEKQDDGTITFNGNTEGFRSGIRYIKELYDEGLFGEDSFTMTEEQLRQLGENPDPIMGAVGGAYMGVFTVVGADSDRYRQYQFITPIKGPDGTQQAYNAPFTAKPQILITDKMKNPELAVRWADWFYSEEGTITGFFGLEGEGWIDPPEGALSFTGTPALYAIPKVAYEESISGSGGLCTFSWQWTAPVNRDRRIREGLYVDEEEAKVNIDVLNILGSMEKYNGFVNLDKSIPNMFFEEQDALTLSQIATPLQNYVREAFADMVLGRKSVDSDWEAYCTELEAMGVQTYVDLYQKAFDAYNAS